MPDQDELVRIQYAALPHRWSKTGELEVMLITSRRRRRWILPKGWPMKGRKGWETAEIEAREESGVSGAIGKRAVGSFRYDKLLDEDGRVVPCEVTVYPLLVKRTLKYWREQAEREVLWLPALDAAAAAADEGLREIVAAFAQSSTRSASRRQVSDRA